MESETAKCNVNRASYLPSLLEIQKKPRINCALIVVEIVEGQPEVNLQMFSVFRLHISALGMSSHDFSLGQLFAQTSNQLFLTFSGRNEYS